MEQLLVQFGDVQQFFQKEDLGSPTTRVKLLALITDANTKTATAAASYRDQW